MNKKIIFIFMSCLLWHWPLTPCHASIVERLGTSVTIHPDEGEARVVRLQVMDDGIIRVQATNEETLPQKEKSLIVVAPSTSAITMPARPSPLVSEKAPSRAC